MIARTSKRAAICLLIVGWCTIGASPPKSLRGAITGLVTNSAGVPQIGATVLLYNSLERLVSRSLTDEAGSFLFDSLAPGVYSLRVSLASYLPAVKRNILVQPGMRSLLSVNLAGALSSIELVYASKSTRSIISDDYKWALRSASATRPVLRFTAPVVIADSAEQTPVARASLSETHGLVKISAGDQGRVSQLGNETDLGTAFAVATSMFGKNHLRLSGNLGYSAAAGAPATGFRTSFRRGSSRESSPEVDLTIQQLYLPARAGLMLYSRQAVATPPLRMMSVGVVDRKSPLAGLEIEYGLSLESVSFLDSLNYFSPFLRASYELGRNGTVSFAFSSGLPPFRLLNAVSGSAGELQNDLAALATFPRVSLRDGRVRVQRTQNLELGYRHTAGSRIYGIWAYLENVRNAALTMVAEAGSVPPTDLLPDLLSNSSVFNVGDYSGAGFMTSVTQVLGNHLNVTLAAGGGNALIPLRPNPAVRKPDELRRSLNHGQRRWIAMQIAAKLPGTGTMITTSYRWADGKSITAPHAYLTIPGQYFETGWNAHIRQPLPTPEGIPGKIELTGDLRNLMGQGYLPLSFNGRRSLLLHSPRSIRGGVNFIF